jgi:hypothetical protein
VAPDDALVAVTGDGADGDGIDELLRVVARALHAPGIAFTLDVTQTGRELRGRGWASEEVAALSIPLDGSDDPMCALLAVDPSLLAPLIARVVQLGPRPRRKTFEVIPVEPAVVGAIKERAHGGEAFPADDPTVAALAAAIVRHWQLTVAWRHDDGSLAGRSVEVVDAGSEGYWLVGETTEEEGSTPRPALLTTTPSGVWGLLTALWLPAESDGHVDEHG